MRPGDRESGTLIDDRDQRQHPLRLRHPRRDRRRAGHRQPGRIDAGRRPEGGTFSGRVTQDWRERFIRAYDIEFQEWIDGIASGGQFGPSSWDGYAAAAVSDAAVEALHDDSRVVIKLIDKPDLYR